MASARSVLLVTGSLRARSTTSAALRTVAAVAPPGTTTVWCDAIGTLPHFNPDDDVDPLPPAVDGLRSLVHRADAILFSTPEYAGALPGSFKNLLDWLIGDDQAGSVDGKPVAWCNVSPRGALAAHQSLRTVLTYASTTIVDEACVAVPVTGAMVGADGLIADPTVRRALVGSILTLVGACG